MLSSGGELRATSFEMSPVVLLAAVVFVVVAPKRPDMSTTFFSELEPRDGGIDYATVIFKGRKSRSHEIQVVIGERERKMVVR